MAKQKRRLRVSLLFEKKIFLIFPLILFLSFILKGISLPYVGYNAWNFNIYSLIAHNYNKFGFFETKFAPIISVSEKFPDNPQYYLHHPPLISVSEALIFRVLGESYASGRITVILFALGSLFLFYIIAKGIFGQRSSIIAAAIYAVLPTSIVFGRMIGQEQLVLFFVLLSLVFYLQYKKTQRRVYRYALYGSVFLGTLSDWPMVYFTLFLLLYLLLSNEKRLAITLLGVSSVTASLFLLSVTSFGGIPDLLSAFLVRSPGALLQMPFWPFKWALTLLIRFIVYFNPIFFTLAILTILKIITDIINKKIHNTDILLLCLTGFGLMHIILYPEGSFGHPYWIYYLTPAVTLLCTYFFTETMIKKKSFLMTGIFLFSISYLWAVNTWKVREIQGNIFRHELAKRASTHLKPYEEILINEKSAIDADIFLYQFKHPSVLLQDVNSVNINAFDHVVYSCIASCMNDKKLAELKKTYYSENIVLPQGQAYIFSLERKSQETLSKDSEKDGKHEKKVILPVHTKKSLFRELYSKFLSLTGAPQL